MLTQFFKFQRPVQPAPTPAAIYSALRSRILSLSPVENGIKPSAQLPSVWGILMEIGYPNGTATLACLADGTTSLYTSSGGGILGCGDLEAVAKASRSFLTAAEMSAQQMEPTAVFPMPRIRKVRFYVLTFGGTLTSEVDEALLNRGKHRFTRLFYYGQEVITQIRLHEEQRKPLKNG
jgi:hypothetical protein